MSDFLTAIGSIFSTVIQWIPTVLTTMFEQPIILFCFAFAFVGVVIRWARKVVHF